MAVAPSAPLPPAGPVPVPGVLAYPAGAMVVIGGLPGAGKSTFLRRVELSGAVRVLDSEQVQAAWRARLGTARGYGLYRPLVHLAHHLRIARALAREPGAVVVHETATRELTRRWLATWARRHGREAHLLLLDVDPATAEEGQRARGRRVRPRSMARHVRAWNALRADLGRARRAGYVSCTVLDREAAGRARALRFAS
jgi:predicted kinase